ncbi:MAG: aminotransferase class V-fold PLP-dependent enzyme, partial [Proteobacteria bacterium]
IVLSELEHHSNLLPWLQVAEQTGCKIEWISVSANGQLNFEQYLTVLKSAKVRLVAFANVSHVLGNRQPAREIIAAAKQHGAWTVVDATQSVAREAINVHELGCDALAFSGHKIYAPTGVGVLFANTELQKSMKPFHVGGGMVDRITKTTPPSWRQGPWKFEAGTPPIEGAVALAEAIRFVQDNNAFEHASRETDMIEKLARFLAQTEGVNLFGWGAALQRGEPIPPHEGILSFSLDGLHPHDIAQTLADHGVAVRAGHHCAQILTDSIAPDGCVRVSLAIYNSEHDLRNFETAFQSCLKLRSEMNV